MRHQGEVCGHAAEFSRIFIARRTFGGGADVAMRISEVRGTAGHRGVRTRPEEPQSESASAETNGALMTFGMMWILLQAAIGEVDEDRGTANSPTLVTAGAA